MTKIRVRPRPLKVDPAKPFEVDLFGRAEFAKALSRVAASATVDEERGLVIAIDGDWGVGKTTFLSQWKAQTVGDAELGQPNERFIYLDAFQADAVDDPFASMVAAIETAFFESGTRTSKAKNALKKSLRTASISIAKAGLRIGIGVATAGISEHIASAVTAYMKETDNSDFNESLGDVVETGRDQALESESLSNMGERLARARDLGSLTEGYREALEKAARSVSEKTGGPVIFVIDELDRCRPTYAVNLIETARQFFDVKNIVFVLMMHKRQICDAICHVYGSGVDASRYLQKFVHVDLKLPTYGDRSSKKHYVIFSESMADQFEIWSSIRSIDAAVETGEVKLMAEAIAEICYYSSMSLREIERIYGSISLLILALSREKEIGLGGGSGAQDFSISLASALSCLRYCDEKSYKEIIIDEDIPDPREIKPFQKRKIVPSLTDPMYNSLLWFVACSTDIDKIVDHFWNGDLSDQMKVRTDAMNLVRHWGGDPLILANTVRQYAIYLDSIRPNV